MVSISVVIPARNAQATIGYCLESLRLQCRKPEEVIIVVDPPNDPTLKYVEELLRTRHFPFTLKILIGPGGVGGARNIGVANATGDIIAFIDSDEVASLSWLYYIEKIFKEYPHVMAVSGPVIYVDDLSQALTYSSNAKKTDLVVREGDLNIVRMPNFAIRKEVVGAIGNFDPRFEVCHEDTDFFIRLLKSGIKMFYTDNAVVYHVKKKASTLKGIKSSIPIGAHNARLFLKHPQRITIKIFYMDLGHAFLITLAVIVLAATGSPTASLLIILPSVLYKIVKALIIRRDPKLMIRRLTIEYVHQLLFTVGFLLELGKNILRRFRT